MSEKKKNNKTSAKRKNENNSSSKSSVKDTSAKKVKTTNTTGKKKKATTMKYSKKPVIIKQESSIKEEFFPIENAAEEIVTAPEIAPDSNEISTSNEDITPEVVEDEIVEETEIVDSDTDTTDEDIQPEVIEEEIVGETEITDSETDTTDEDIQPEIIEEEIAEETETIDSETDTTDEDIQPETVEEIKIEDEIKTNPFAQAFKSVKDKANSLFSKTKKENTNVEVDIKEEDVESGLEQEPTITVDVPEIEIDDEAEITDDSIKTDISDEDIKPEVVEEVKTDDEITANPFAQAFKSIRDKTNNLFSKTKKEKPTIELDKKEIDVDIPSGAEVEVQDIQDDLEQEPIITVDIPKIEIEEDTSVIDVEEAPITEEKISQDIVETEGIGIKTPIQLFKDYLEARKEKKALKEQERLALEKDAEENKEIEVIETEKRIEARSAAIVARLDQLKVLTEEVRYPHEIFSEWQEKRRLENDLITVEESIIAIDAYMLDEDLGVVPTGFFAKLNYYSRAFNLRIRRIRYWFSLHPVMERLTKLTVFLVTFSLTLVLVSVVTYLGYLVTSYERFVGDDDLDISRRRIWYAEVNQEYSITTYNVGFGCFDSEFSYILENGKMANGKSIKGSKNRADDEKRVENNINGIGDVSRQLDSDFFLFQEIDIGSTRSYLINQQELLFSELIPYSKTFGQNIHTRYLFYPIGKEIGLINAGVSTMSRYRIESGKQIMLPTTTDFFSRFSDLDNSVTITYIPVYNQTFNDHPRYLALINVHFAAFNHNSKIMEQQWEQIKIIMKEEYEYGNYVIVGGDFGYQLYDHNESFNGKQKRPIWLEDFPVDSIPEHFSLVVPENISEVATNRSGELPYEKGVNYESSVDGFIISDNIEASALIIDTQYQYSDHNPVQLKFTLTKIK